MSTVEYVRPELTAILPKYQLLRDLLKGELAVKAAKTTYLPVPNVDVQETDERYKAYILRAVLYNVTARTLEGLTGQIFLRDPVTEVPTELEPLLENANGANITLTQMSKRSSRRALAYGRGGLFTDFPTMGRDITRAEINSGQVSAVINAYAPWDITNWYPIKLGTKVVLGMVVLREYEDSLDEFEIETKVRYRVLRLTSTGTLVEVWSKNQTDELAITEQYTLRGADGEALNELPFDFIGSDNNDSEIDEPPLYDMGSLNMAHYRNSADFEESCFMLGQPTPYFWGLTQQWVDDVLKGTVVLGSRAAVMLPEKGGGGLLQANPNTLAREAMQDKQEQMFALGAKLVKERRVERTATEAELESASENSVLSTVAKNVSQAYTKALQRAANYVGIDGSEIKFELNTNFDLTSMTAEELRIVLEGWATFDAIATTEMREAVRRSGLGNLPDAEYEAQIIKDQELKSKLNFNKVQQEADNRSTTATGVDSNGS